MRLTDQQITNEFEEACRRSPRNSDLYPLLLTTVRRCLAMAAMPDVPHQAPYNDVERRGFEVSQPAELL